MRSEAPLLSSYSIKEQFDGVSVLLTGASGFIGSVVLEQLLRCTSVRRVYVLLRAKGDTGAAERLAGLLGDELFHLVHDKLATVQAVAGDVALPALGLSDAARRQLMAEVGVIIHSAASIHLDSPILAALAANYKGTEAVLQLAASCAQLRAVVHVSSIGVNCNRPGGARVHECLYSLPSEPDTDPCAVAEEWLALPADAAASASAARLSAWGFDNTYTFSKFAAEHLVAKYHQQGLPVAIVRPALTTPAAGMPVQGYMGASMAGTMGISAAVILGLHASTDAFPWAPDFIFDCSPVDMVSSVILAAAAATAAEHQQGGAVAAGPAVVATQAQHPAATAAASSSAAAAAASDPAAAAAAASPRPAPHAATSQPAAAAARRSGSGPSTPQALAHPSLLIVHAASSDTYPLTWAELYGTIHRFVAQHPRPFAVCQRLPPLFGPDGYAPDDGKRRAHDGAMVGAVRQACSALRASGSARAAAKVAGTLKISQVLSKPGLVGRYVFTNAAACALEARLAPGEAREFLLVWRRSPSTCWEEYNRTMLRGIYRVLYGAVPVPAQAQTAATTRATPTACNAMDVGAVNAASRL